MSMFATRRTKGKPKNGLKAYAKRNQRLRSSGFASYQDYLASPEWKALREAALSRDNHRCVACRQPATCVHHGNYTATTLFARLTNSIVSLCGGCHKFVEFDARGQKTSMKQARDRLRFLCRKQGGSLPGMCPKCMKVPGQNGGLCRRCRRRPG